MLYWMTKHLGIIPCEWHSLVRFPVTPFWTSSIGVEATMDPSQLESIRGISELRGDAITSTGLSEHLHAA